MSPAILPIHVPHMSMSSTMETTLHTHIEQSTLHSTITYNTLYMFSGFATVKKQLSGIGMLLKLPQI